MLRDWLLYKALPLWSKFGVDIINGGFYERLTHDLSPIDDLRRTRLVSRQIYLFATGKLLGWDGPADNLINHGLRFLNSYLVSSDGTIAASCDMLGRVSDSRHYLYDTAFVLLALAKISQLSPDNYFAEKLARTIASNLSERYSHPLGGYIEPSGSRIYCSNPHMHLLEAFLAWIELDKPDNSFWHARAKSLVHLSCKFLVVSDCQLIAENFDSHWQPLSDSDGIKIEPGHQFEWSWLLSRWSQYSHDNTSQYIARHLCQYAETYGVDHIRNVVVERINESLEINDSIARLWQQTERVKAWHQQFLITNASLALENRDKAIKSLLNFLSNPVQGLWYDQMDIKGNFPLIPVKASSAYHIACAVHTIS